MTRYKRCYYFDKCKSLLGANKRQEACQYCLKDLEREMKYLELARLRYIMYGNIKSVIKRKIRKYTRYYLV